MKFAFIFILVLFLLGNFYVFYRVWQLMPPNTITRVLLIVFAVIVVSSLFISFIFGDSMPVTLTSFFYKIGTSWIFIFLYLLILALIKDLIRLVRLVPADTFTYYTRDNWLGFGLAIGFITMLMVAGYLKYRWKVRVEVPLVTEKTLEKKNSFRIVGISDLHIGYGIGQKELQQWVEMINKENPDIVIIAGDIIDNSVRPLNQDDFAGSLKQLKAPFGVYACPGNHEYISGIKESTTFITGAGINFLKDSSVLIDSTLYIVGRDDRSNTNRKSLSELVSRLDRSKPIIVLDHQPYNLEEAEENGIDFQFSGHTHRGQIWPISLVTDMIYEKSHGLLKKGKSNIYVSSGIGIWGGKFRIGTQSEYVVIDIKN